MKYILITGGVISGVGKGTIASSIGVCLKVMGIRTTAIKIDPYLNVDAGTMAPQEHGEVFVLDDGSEVDLDLGNYERFLGFNDVHYNLTGRHSITTGKIYNSVISKERHGNYLGKTVQVVPHITAEIQDWIKSTAKIPVEGDAQPEVCIIELGGTIGDIESMPFVEALRQMQASVEANSMIVIHVGFVPSLHGEHKTKPIQNSAKMLNQTGLHCDMIIARSTKLVSTEVLEKISMFCGAKKVFPLCDTDNIYEVPSVIRSIEIDRYIMETLQLKIEIAKDNFHSWDVLSKEKEDLSEYGKTVKIALVGKYSHPDAYHSLLAAIDHAAVFVGVNAIVKYVNAELLTDDGVTAELLSEYNAILIPGGFGERGAEGMIRASSYAAKADVPFLGICFGFQLAIVSIARTIRSDATSKELAPTAPRQVITRLESFTEDLGGTMRLGSKKIVFADGSPSIYQRHRHRYEVNPKWRKILEKLGVEFVATDETGLRTEIIRLRDAEHFVGVQFHPELTSRPGIPSDTIASFLDASITHSWRAESVKH